MHSRRAALLAAASLALTNGAGAQTDGTPADRIFGESVEVRVVNVDVIVTDRDGQPVLGLERGDFQVFEDGKAQEITNFYRVEGVRVRAEGEDGWEVIAPDSSFRRRILLLIDNNFIETPERNRAVAALESYLDQKFDGSYEWGVVSVGDEVRVLEPFTSDKLRVRSALDRVKATPTFGARYRIERNFLNDPVRVRRAQRNEAAVGGEFGAGSSTDPNEEYLAALRFESKFNIASTLEAFQRTSTAMVQAFRAYSGLAGNKVLIWITGGVPMLPEYAFQGEGTSGGGRSDKDRELHEYQRELQELVATVAWEANAAQFKVYPIKATGLRPEMPQNDPGFRSSGTTFSDAAFSAPVEVDDSDSAQLSLALGTGGLYLTSNRTLESFETADHDSAAYYSLGYRPQRPEDGALHEIRVEVAKPGLIARSRSGYVDLGSEKKLEMTLAAPLPFPREKGTLPVRVSVARPTGGDVVATVELPNTNLTFVPEGDFFVGRVKIYLTIHDAEGHLVDLVREQRDLRFPAAQRADVLAGKFRYGLKFHLDKPGSYVVSVTVRDEATDEIGTGFSNVEI
jgi:VWFA-related protein